MLSYQEARMDLQVLGEIGAAAQEVASRAREDGFHVAIAIVDAGGHLLHFHRDPRARLVTVTTAVGKARCAVMFDRSTETTVEIAQANPLAFSSFVTASELPFVIGHGGEIVRSGETTVAVGVAGANAEQDDALAKHLAERIAATMAG
jgi:glc operon protein GlcG